MHKFSNMNRNYNFLVFLPLSLLLIVFALSICLTSSIPSFSFPSSPVLSKLSSLPLPPQLLQNPTPLLQFSIDIFNILPKNDTYNTIMSNTTEFAHKLRARKSSRTENKQLDELIVFDLSPN